MDGTQFTVCICCTTFNHSRYIKDAVSGFVMQETDFPFVATIVDDASTDGEPQVLREYYYRYFDYENSEVAYQEEAEYGTILYAQHRVNRNCFFAIVLLKENHFSQNKNKLPYYGRWSDKAEFIALCEGDDYWTDPKKLQAQVDFLNEREEYSLCCHRYKIYNQNLDTWEEDYVKRLFENHPDGFSFTRAENLKTWITKTMTLMYRRDCFDEKEMQLFKYRCDEHLNYLLLSRGPGFCFPFFGAVYRKTDSGVFAPLPEKEKRIRGVLIRSELLTYNLQDIVLRDDVFGRLKKFIYQYGPFSGMKIPIWVCLKSYYKTDGFKGCLRSAKKLLGAYIKGFSTVSKSRNLMKSL